MTNQVWEDDPRRLTFLLARYKFVSKMLSGKKFVGELGCGDAFGTRIVMQTTEKVIAYDFDPVFIEDIRGTTFRALANRGPLSRHPGSAAAQTSMMASTASTSLSISGTDEDIDIVDNLAISLTDDGVLIIGSPSLESQAYASPPSKAGTSIARAARS